MMRALIEREVDKLSNPEVEGVKNTMRKLPRAVERWEREDEAVGLVRGVLALMMPSSATTSLS